MLDYKKLPSLPGVYLMKDDAGQVIYVGKAKSLKNRVSQYFQNNKAHSPKVRAMVSNIANFEYVLTNSEFEAFILECNLIKKYRPHYNILLKDDKTFPYLRISIKDPYPKMSVARKIKEDGAIYIGPFLSVKTIRDTIDLVKRLFGIATCSRVFPRDIGKERPCLNYHMKLCIAPCLPTVSEEEYKNAFSKAITFLRGERSECLAMLRADMKSAVERLDFEYAARVRDTISEIEKLDQKQAVVLHDKRDLDCIAIEKSGDCAYVHVYFVRSGVLLNRYQTKLEDCKETEVTELLYAFLQQFYDKNRIPDEILLPLCQSDFTEIEVLLSQKRGKKVSVSVPQRGDKKKLVDMAMANVKEFIEKEESEQEASRNLLAQFCEYTDSKVPPRRIESIDISHTSGAQSVGAVIVFEDGKPSRKDYRYFKIKYVEGNNDYDSLCEVLYRRIERARNSSKGFSALPDLLLVDGGKTHVSIVRDYLESIGCTDIPVLGIVKNDSHRTRGLTTDKEEFTFKENDPFFRLLVEIQNEVHNSAIRFHQKQRSRSAVQSRLLKIDGVGEVRRRELMKTFKTIRAIENASIDELLRVPSMDRTTALKIFEHFHAEP